MSLYPVDMQTRISTANLLQLLVLFLPTRTVQCSSVTRAPAPENMTSQRIDVHHHFVPEFYAQALRANGGDPSGWSIPDWSLEKDLSFNDEQRISFAFLTITAPGAEILPLVEQAGFCRQANQAAAEIRAAQPARYGFFATIPSLLDPEAAHTEIIHALDELQADGIILYTRYGSDNHYLGHPDFRSTWDLLNKRRATVFVHPTHPVDTHWVNPSLPQPMIDYPHETTRTAVDLIISGIMREFTDVKIILSHAGGTLPYLALRPAAVLPYLPPSIAPPIVAAAVAAQEGHHPTDVTNQFMEDAKRFYFDTALSTGSHTLSLLKEFAKPDHVLYGSDFPYAPSPAIADMNARLDRYGAEKDEAFVQSAASEAALKLFPRLSNVLSKNYYA
ncbi:hypothetical protein GE21DRAFT_8399 [Neurospora crassa]|uniref:6-methylsalicylate decarboxylase n=1 Tax=Neurospora crassa (strain ATCC 24698 / 74-OR23-1A / CBS 708.71 / DSM 1257 / FGSC 987) TaxID=367110 RepID=Q7S0G8_NEUCR|nr:amidohydrolase [Neurospora crassa OR74A]EAA28806.2 amidohydrolase [Neurospora crassa OR74A]KHE82042.1 hypothetical protein GE21DRAFT_8399 [Neurospora crassa]|eukprot:XP_958042.2 amidohydrolase [Neurospora crassa OR74A]